MSYGFPLLRKMKKMTFGKKTRKSRRKSRSRPREGGRKSRRSRRGGGEPGDGTYSRR